MKWLTAPALAIAALMAPVAAQATPAAARPVTDCPLRDAPFTLDSPLYDVLLSPAAKAAVERVRPGFVAGIPPFFASSEVPSFATILSFKTMVRFNPATTQAELDQLAAALRTVPVTAADRVARCVRYDNDRPNLTVTPGRPGQPRVLIFEKMTGFRDGPSVEAARAAFVGIAQREGYAYAVTEAGGAINPRTLRQFDVIVWNNVSGDVLTLAQRRVLRSWIEHGGGFVAVHGSAGDPTYYWDWYVDSLIGARFTGHPSDPQFQDATVHMEQSASGIGAGLPASFTMNDEWYSFVTSPRPHVNVIATLDESTYRQVGRFGTNITMGADHPIVWNHCVGRGRSFYSAIGHRPEQYAEPRYVTMLTQAITWAARRGGTC